MENGPDGNYSQAMKLVQTLPASDWWTTPEIGPKPTRRDQQFLADAGPCGHDDGRASCDGQRPARNRQSLIASRLHIFKRVRSWMQQF